MVYIYSLVDPRTNQIRYVGKTVNFQKRLKHHINENRNRTHKEQWIHGLKKQGLLPQLEILDIVPETEWQFWESWWISLLRSWSFDLTNIGFGGEGGNDTPETRLKISIKNKGNKYRVGTKFTEEQKANMSKVLTGRKLSTQHIANKAKGCFKSIDLDRLKYHYSLTQNYTELSKIFGLSESKIYKTLRDNNLILAQRS
jgi:group I intron endonuclease